MKNNRVPKNLLGNLQKQIVSASNPQKAKSLAGYFKTGKGEYGEGDIFLGITVPICRSITTQFLDLSLSDIRKLVHSKFHEERLIALFIAIHQFEKGDKKKQKEIFDFYLQSTAWINNWDLVDLSAYRIVGSYLFKRQRNILFTLAASKNLWERRIAILSTFYFIKQKDFTDSLKIATLLLIDTHDLIHKAVGWMLREVGKQDKTILLQFLEKNYKKMPRTMLRYSLERVSQEQKTFFMKK